ncbi:MAG: PAS domain S-box protein, partial [Rhodoferax sp.]|nr:PAS domain S-box protein [Rhodoferax sp.]
TFAYVCFALLSTLLMTGLLTARLLATMAHESRLREAQRLAARVFENSNDGIVITDAETRILSANPAFERTEAVGQKTQLLSSGLQNAEFYAELWQKLNETGEWRGEIINRRKDGSLLSQWLTINRMYDADGRITGYLGFFLDLSELRRSEQLVRRLSTAMEQSPSSILITNLKGEIEYVNPQFERVTGYRADEA